MDPPTANRRRALEAELREIKKFEAQDRAANPKVAGTPGEATERKYIPTRWQLRALTHRNYRCAGLACRAPFTGPHAVPAEFDHIIALGLGGAHRSDNIQALCPPCHLEKTKRDVASIAKAKRIAAKHFGTKEPSKRPLQSRNTFR